MKRRHRKNANRSIMVCVGLGLTMLVPYLVHKLRRPSEARPPA
jgi:hypothetical protein